MTPSNSFTGFTAIYSDSETHRRLEEVRYPTVPGRSTGQGGFPRGQPEVGQHERHRTGPPCRLPRARYRPGVLVKGFDLLAGRLQLAREAARGPGKPCAIGLPGFVHRHPRREASGNPGTPELTFPCAAGQPGAVNRVKAATGQNRSPSVLSLCGSLRFCAWQLPAGRHGGNRPVTARLPIFPAGSTWLPAARVKAATGRRSRPHGRHDSPTGNGRRSTGPPPAARRRKSPRKSPAARPPAPLDLAAKADDRVLSARIG